MECSMVDSAGSFDQDCAEKEQAHRWPAGGINTTCVPLDAPEARGETAGGFRPLATVLTWKHCSSWFITHASSSSLDTRPRAPLPDPTVLLAAALESAPEAASPAW